MRTVVPFIRILLPALMILTSITDFAWPQNYDHLINILQERKTKDNSPLHPLSSFMAGDSHITQDSNLEYFESNPELINKIQNDLGSKIVAWRLVNTQKRFLFVPEKIDDFSHQYIDYCSYSINHVLRETGLPNPYNQIEMLNCQPPQFPSKKINIYLVQNLVEEIISTYIFSSSNNRSVKINLSNKHWLGEVGSYSSYVTMSQANKPSFEKSQYTIWQTRAENPFNVLAVPLEETLHILFREMTHKAIEKETIEKITYKVLNE